MPFPLPSGARPAEAGVRARVVRDVLGETVADGSDGGPSRRVP